MKMIDATQQMPQQATDISAIAARVKALASAQNLCDQLPDPDLAKLAQSVVEGFDIDKSSMADWETRMQRGIDLAMLTKEEKTYPWQNAANIRYPLITSAALQYNARAYPAIVPSTDVVKVSVQGQDMQGHKSGRAKRVSSYMSWQLKVDSREWERGTDQLTLQLPIVGDVFRKLWWDVTTNRVRSQIRIPGKHVVINNNATTLSTAPRVSDIVDLYPHQVKTNILSGRFRDVNIPAKPEDDHSPESFIEQLCRHDLDNDGYPEPYIVTVHRETQQVVRVVAAYDADTVRIDGQRIIGVDPVPYMVHYQFMPSMDGGLLGTGMGLLLGDISETINSTLNMIMDSGHLSSLGGGFIGAQSFRIKGGVQRVRPGEYKQVNFTGDDIRRGIVDLQFPGPSPVLFQILGMLIESGREITSVSNVMTGDAGRQNMPVGTVMALIEQGQMVFTASYKRIYLALQDEFALVARLNAKNLDPQRYNAFLDGEHPSDPAADFNLTDMDILPVADPNSVTSMQKMGRAQFLIDLAERKMVDPMEVARRVLDAASVENPDALLPKPDENAMKQQMLMTAAQEEMLVIDMRLKEASLEKMEAETLRIIAEAEATAAEVDMLPMKMQIEQLRTMKEGLRARREAIDAGRAGGMAGTSSDGMAHGGPPQGLPSQQGIPASAAMV
jgi:chaperonin GroES